MWAVRPVTGRAASTLALADSGTLSPAQTGFEMSLKARGTWQWAEGADIAQRSEPLTSNHQIDSCARCHARRGTWASTTRVSRYWIPTAWPSSKSRFTGPMGRSATRSMFTAHSFRARCIRLGWPAPIAITRTATNWLQRATAYAPSVIWPVLTITPHTTDIRLRRPVAPAWTAICRASFIWVSTRGAITACASRGRICR